MDIMTLFQPQTASPTARVTLPATISRVQAATIMPHAQMDNCLTEVVLPLWSGMMESKTV